MSKSDYEPHQHSLRLPLHGRDMGVRAHVREVLGMRRSSALLLLFVFFYVGYLVAGGLVFATIEAPAEAQLKAGLIRARQAFLEKHPCVSGRYTARNSSISFLRLSLVLISLIKIANRPYLQVSTDISLLWENR